LKLKYEPKDGKIVPDMRPGDVVEVEGEEAERLLATGLFVPLEEAKKKPRKEAEK